MSAYRTAWLCTDCGLYCHREDEAADHREETGHSRVVVLTQDKTAANANYRRNRRRARSAADEADWRGRELEERLAAIFGGPR